MKKTLSIFTRPVPLWLFALWMAGGMSVAALAAVPLYTGSLSVPAAGTITHNDLSASQCVGLDGSKVEKGNTNCVASITGTANRVTASAATGAITLSGPQDIGTTSNVLFASLDLTNKLTADIIQPHTGSGNVVIQNTGGTPLFTFSGTAGTLTGNTSGGISAGTGTLQASSNASTTSYVGPAYTTAGAAVASTWHTVAGNANAVLNGNCTAETINCAMTSNTLTLSGAAVFADGNYVCSTTNTDTPGAVVRATATSGSVVGFTVSNLSGATISGTVNFTISCMGPTS